MGPSGTWAAGITLRALVRRFVQDHGFLLASGLSFAFLLCLAPLILILFSIAGFLLESDDIAEYLYDSLTLLLPAYGREFAEFLALLARERAVTGIVGGVGLGLFVTQFFSLTRTVMNLVFRVRVRRGLAYGFAVDVLGVIVVGALVGGFAVVVVTLVALGEVLLRLAPLPLPLVSGSRRLLSVPVIYAVGMGLLFFVYRVLPNTAVAPRAAATATVAVTLLWGVAGWVFSAYIETFGVYGRLYGSFGVGVAALVWIYYSAIIFVLGAELAAMMTEGGVASSVAASDRTPEPHDREGAGKEA